MIRGAPAGRLARWRRVDLRRLLLGDPWLKVAAISVALLLWISAARTTPPADVTQRFDGRIPVERPEVPAGFVLRGQLGDVEVTLRGPAAAVAAIGQPELRATLDLANVEPGPEPQDAPVRVTIADPRVRVVEVTPPSVAIRLERRTERVLVVQFRSANDPPAGFHAGAATFRPQEVIVSGPESLVATVAAVLATVRFGDAPVDLAQDVRPIPVDAAGQAVEGVQVDPVAVQASVPVLSTATTRTVPVLWQLRGAVATGYWISRVTTDPVAVTISGERQIVTAVERIETGPVDVGGLTASRTFEVPLLFPDGVKVVGQVRATLTVTVVALAGTRPFPLVAVQVVNLGAGFAAEVDPRTVSTVLSGTVPVLSALGAESVTAIVDASGRGAGTHSLEVTVRAPSGTSVQSLQPARVTVTITTRQ
jgi:YbbR domain-containing protein